MILSDNKIWLRAKQGMIYPFFDYQSIKTKISRGLSSCGYDATLGDNFKIFQDTWNTIIDPHNLDPRAFINFNSNGSFCTIPPNGYVLGESVEYFKIPKDICVICIGKSTYARCGIIANVTPLEPEWEGRITIELSNSSRCPARVYSGEGIIQLLFINIEGSILKTYKDKQGKYQNQKGLTLAK